MQNAIPEVLQSKTAFFEKNASDLQHPLIESVKKLLLISNFSCRRIDLLRTLLKEDQCQNLLSRTQYFAAASQLSLDWPQNTFMSSLRKFRTTHFLRLLLLELAGIATTEQIMRSWSDCADALIMQVLDYCKQSLFARYGTPTDQQGQQVQLFCLAMGKLGGRELNYSSDIDLIFCYAKAGETDGLEQIDNIQYFTKLIQLFVQIMQTTTEDGFVYRVDLRLRPHGESGSLVLSLASMETYYQEQGRGWERYAMVKARIISEQLQDVPSWFQSLITPFVYRRYVDFSVIESLRSMKALIEREVRLNPRLDDIKRGKGGIREIEFIIQNFQLIRGGRMPRLQQQNALSALAVLKQEHLFSRSDTLKTAYLFLRQLENVLQSLDDKQTHSLPNEEIQQAQIAYAMDFSSWSELEVKLHKYQRIISAMFSMVLGKVEAYEDEERLLSNQLSILWQGHMEDSMAVNLLTSLNYANAQQCYQMIHAFRHSRKCRRLSQSARMHLDRFMVLLLTELKNFKNTDQVLLQVMHLLENILSRSPYIALLTENPQSLHELLYWLESSPFITSLLSSQPFLLEVLLNQQQDWKPVSIKQLQIQLQEQLAHSNDIEVQENILRQFKSTHWLMAARAELYGLCHSVRIGQFLADLAEVIVQQVWHLAFTQLCIRYPEMQQIKSRFTIIAYGTLGSREMNFNSDLDLVFLHNAKPSEEALVTRLTQKIVHMLTIRSHAGVLYAVDTRLRPSGSAGLLVSHVDAFINYQRTQAWTWEHQSLLKARVLLGSARVKYVFQSLKKSILQIKRDKTDLKKDVLQMRDKMNQVQETDPIKFDPGGLLDLEFLVQFLMLRVAKPDLARYVHTLNQLQQLFLAKALTKEQYSILKNAYGHYHHLLHQNIVHPELTVNPKIQKKVLEVCQTIY